MSPALHFRKKTYKNPTIYRAFWQEKGEGQRRSTYEKREKRELKGGKDATCVVKISLTFITSIVYIIKYVDSHSKQINPNCNVFPY